MTDAGSHDVPRPGDEGHDIAWPVPLWTIVPLALALTVLMAWRFGASLMLVSVVPLMGMLAAITVIDLRELRVPNAILRPAAVVAVPAIVIASFADWSDLSLIRAVLGALAMGAVYFVMALINPAGMGMGDVKLAPFLGAQLALFGWIPLVRGLFLAFLIVGPVAILLLLFRRAGAKTGLPFAPFMAAGTIAALVLETL